MTVDDRQRAKMLIINAVGYKEAAAAVHAAPGMFHWPPFYMLLCFSIEFSLKAFLASRGVAEDELKSLGHNLPNALARAVAIGLRTDIPEFEVLLNQMAEAHRLHEFRYLKDRSIEVVEPDQALAIVEMHIRSVGAQVPISALD